MSDNDPTFDPEHPQHVFAPYPEPEEVDVCLYCLGAGYHDGGDMRDDEPCNACGGTGIDPSTVRDVQPPATPEETR